MAVLCSLPLRRCEAIEFRACPGGLRAERGAEVVSPGDSAVCLGDGAGHKSVCQEPRCVQLCPVKLNSPWGRICLSPPHPIPPHTHFLYTLSPFPVLSVYVYQKRSRHLKMTRKGGGGGGQLAFVCVLSFTLQGEPNRCGPLCRFSIGSHLSLYANRGRCPPFVLSLFHELCESYVCAP